MALPVIFAGLAEVGESAIALFPGVLSSGAAALTPSSELLATWASVGFTTVIVSGAAIVSNQAIQFGEHQLEKVIEITEEAVEREGQVLGEKIRDKVKNVLSGSHKSKEDSFKLKDSIMEHHTPAGKKRGKHTSEEVSPYGRKRGAFTGAAQPAAAMAVSLGGLKKRNMTGKRRYKKKKNYNKK